MACAPTSATATSASRMRTASAASTTPCGTTGSAPAGTAHDSRCRRSATRSLAAVAGMHHPRRPRLHLRPLHPPLCTRLRLCQRRHRCQRRSRRRRRCQRRRRRQSRRRHQRRHRQRRKNRRWRRRRLLRQRRLAQRTGWIARRATAAPTLRSSATQRTTNMLSAGVIAGRAPTTMGRSSFGRLGLARSSMRHRHRRRHR
mmetsp:Transcript_20931/g.72204  ORF Transcript_20931/g.72204 Transcript_20931/m.72204 type:complete len:200 (+) Transcript_20931:238-837(+)